MHPIFFAEQVSTESLKGTFSIEASSETSFSLAEPLGAGGAFGCGILTEDPQPPRYPPNPEGRPPYNEGHELFNDPRFRLLDTPTQQRFKGEWSGIQRWQDRLIEEGKAIKKDHDDIADQHGKVSEAACRLKAKYDEKEVRAVPFRRICQGRVDPETYRWCQAELLWIREREEEGRVLRELMREEIRKANTMTRAWIDRYDAWVKDIEKFDGHTAEFNARLLKQLRSAGKWTCKAKCQHVKHGGGSCEPPWVHGQFSAPDEDTACREAKRLATQSASRGCYARHCKCDCSKR